MNRKTKTGSSRRKGDEYQDLTALELALELYINGTDFELFIEYEKAGSFDDVLVVSLDRVDGYQVKHAVNDNAVYIADDLTSSKSSVFIEKFAKSFNRLKEEFPDREIGLHLRSNRGLDAQLGKLVDGAGFFDQKFQQGRYRKEKGELRKALKDATGLNGQNFQEFIQYFHFDLKHPSWKKLELYIQDVLLDHKLGVSDRRVFADLKRLIEQHAIEVADPITPQLIDAFLRDSQTRYLLPQMFPVEKERFVKPPTLDEQLDTQLGNADGEYIVITGPPGSGKSTALSEYFEDLEIEKSNDFAIVRYYCFVRVYDNRQRLRLEAKSLRVNLLTELQRCFPHVLDARRFDYSEQRFLEALEIVGNNCREQGKKLAIFIDGLDHVERDSKLRDSIIEALPNELPLGIIFVIGTQELHHWKPLALRKGREERHIQMPLFSREETHVYVTDRCGIVVSDDTLNRIHEKSAGLPLYLRYLAEIAAASDEPETAIETIPAAVNGQIRSYYEMLWVTFDAQGWSDAKYMSAVLCSLRFSVHEDELFGFQQGIADRPRFEAAFRRLRHLLRVKDNLVAIFHNSFRIFVLDQTDNDTKHEISAAIVTRLKDEALQSARWFKHVFHYALDAHDYAYVLDQVNHPFVDAALIRFRHEDEIMDAIHCAIEAAGATSDLVALSRLGSLKYRTHERLEINFPWSRLIEILLYTGRVEQVVNSIYAEETESLVADPDDSLSIMLKLIDIGRKEIAEKVFEAFLKGFRGNGDLNKYGLIHFARCAGIFPTRVSTVVHWLARTQLQKETLEPKDFAPGYAPHLAAYLDGLVSVGRDRLWQLLSKVRKPFPNNLMRHLIIRAVAKHKSADVLRSEIEQYAEVHPDDTNVELGYFAAKAGMSPDFVNRLAGQFYFPPERVTHETLRTDLEGHVRGFAYWSVIFGYEQNNETTCQIRTHLVGSIAVWSCIQSHLLKVGNVVGSHYADREIDWFATAEQAVQDLEAARDVPGERTPDALDACRYILPESLFWLSEILVARCPKRIDDWIKILTRLRESFMWTTHYGINEYITDYSFEFAVWRKQAELPQIRSRLKPILSACAKSYDEALSLKGGARGDHFLTIAALAARCGYQSTADTWMRRGVKASLAYGYRKDITLENLADIVEILDKYQPEKTLARCAAILEMVKWMPSVTDGRDTQHFAQHLIPIVTQNNRSAALALLRGYYNHFAKWQANESLNIYLLSRSGGDAEFLWALAALLDPNESVAARQHIAKLGTASAQSSGSWTEHLSKYIMMISNPRHWPDELWNQALQLHERPERKRRNEGTNHDHLTDKTYQLNGLTITVDEVRQRCQSSFSEMVTTMQKLKDQNEHVSNYSLFDAALPFHIANAATLEDLTSIRMFYDEHAWWRQTSCLEQIGLKYLELGDVSNGLEYLEHAIHEGMTRSLHHEGTIQGPLVTLTEYDRDRARAFVTSELQEQLQGPSYHGFTTPHMVAVACDVLGETEHVEQVFEDYLHHCQELFAQLPDEPWFDELKGWKDSAKDENAQIVHLLIDRLESPESEFGKRLIIAISELVATRGDAVVPILIERTMSAEGLQFWRLLALLANLASTNSHLFRMHCHQLISLLERNNVFIRLLVSRSFQLAFEGAPLPIKIDEAIRQIERDYSSTIVYRRFRLLHDEPSRDFVKLIKQGAQFSFRRQLKAACDILNLHLDAVTAHLERRLLETGFTVEEEHDVVRSMWRAFSHAQGWPVIWFISEFHVRINNLLYQLLDEVLIKQRYQPNHVEALWRVLQPSDPEYCAYQLLPIPNDIPPLIVLNKDEWISNHSDAPRVTIEESILADWITAFEFRWLAQDTPYHVLYIAQTDVQSALIRPEMIDEITEFETQYWGEEVGTHNPGENLTWRQFRDALLFGHELEPDENEVCLPFVAYKDENGGFLGFHTIASFSSHVIREFSLACDGFDVFDSNDRVGYFEAWQEGYPDEDYNDQPLSVGVRFRVRADFVRKVVRSSGRAFAVRTIENRFVMKDHKQEPAEQSSSTLIQVWPLS
jgi:hypothetical protein